MFLPGANIAIASLFSSLAINGAPYTLVSDIATLANAIAAKEHYKVPAVVVDFGTVGTRAPRRRSRSRSGRP